jgi:hypothetical protein
MIKIKIHYLRQCLLLYLKTIELKLSSVENDVASIKSQKFFTIDFSKSQFAHLVNN